MEVVRIEEQLSKTHKPQLEKGEFDLDQQSMLQLVEIVTVDYKSSPTTLESASLEKISTKYFK